MEGDLEREGGIPERERERQRKRERERETKRWAEREGGKANPCQAQAHAQVALVFPMSLLLRKQPAQAFALVRSFAFSPLVAMSGPGTQGISLWKLLFFPN